MNKTMMIRSVIVLAAVAAIGWYAASRPVGANAPVATVNGTAITRAQLTAAESQLAAQQGLSATSTEAQAQFESSALDSLINQTLLEQSAKKAGAVASSTVVEAQLASARASFSSADEYQKALAAHSMTEADLRTQITRDTMLNAHLEQQLHLNSISATDAEIKTIYDQITSQQTGTSTPKLSEVRDQVAQMVVKQKQQESIKAYMEQLRKAATIKILIKTSTPAA